MNILLADNLCVALTKMLPKARGRLAYILARDVRLLNTELIEFHNEQRKLFSIYGHYQDGEYVIMKGSEEYQKYLDSLKQFNDIELDIKLMNVNEEDIINSDLNGDEMLILQDYLMEDC